MFRKPSHRVPEHKIPAQRQRELSRSRQYAEVRLRHPHLFRQPE